MAYFECNLNSGELHPLINRYKAPENHGFDMHYDASKKILDGKLPIVSGVLEFSVAPKQITAAVGSYYYEAKNVTFYASTDGINWISLLTASFPGDQLSHEKSQEFDVFDKGYRFFKGTGTGTNISVTLVRAYF